MLLLLGSEKQYLYSKRKLTSPKERDQKSIRINTGDIIWLSTGNYVTVRAE